MGRKFKKSTEIPEDDIFFGHEEVSAISKVGSSLFTALSQQQNSFLSNIATISLVSYASSLSPLANSISTTSLNNLGLDKIADCPTMVGSLGITSIIASSSVSRLEGIEIFASLSTLAQQHQLSLLRSVTGLNYLDTSVVGGAIPSLDRRSYFPGILSTGYSSDASEISPSLQEELNPEDVVGESYSQRTLSNNYYYQSIEINFQAPVALAQIGDQNSGLIQQDFVEESEIVCQLLDLLHESRDSSLLLPDKFRTQAEELIERVLEAAIQYPLGRDFVKKSAGTLARILFTVQANREVSRRILNLMKYL